MTVLIAMICLLIAASIGATAFIFGRQVGYTQRNAELATDRAKALEEQAQYMEMEYKQLQVQYDQERKDNAGREHMRGPWELSDRHARM